MKLKTTTFALCVLYLSNSYAVTNSKMVANGLYPEIVQIKPTFNYSEKSSEQFSCTGTYVGPKTILTAAHCVVVPQSPKDEAKFPVAKMIIAQQINIQGKNDVKVEKIIYYYGLDLALLVLDKATDEYIPISVKEPWSDSLTVKMVGFGSSCLIGCNDLTKKEGNNKIDFVQANSDKNIPGGIIRTIGKVGLNELSDELKIKNKISQELVNKDINSPYESAFVPGDSGSALTSAELNKFSPGKNNTTKSGVCSN